MNTDFIGLLREIQEDKGIEQEVLLEALEQALVSAYKKSFGANNNVRVVIDRETGEMHVYASKEVVEYVEDESAQISLSQAREINESYTIGDTALQESMPATFGRIAAQTARQVVVQRLREAERSKIFQQFADKQGDIITGIVKRIERKNIIVSIDGVEAVLPYNEQVHSEVYSVGDYIKVYLAEVNKAAKGSQLFISRTHFGLVKRLFELEIPEISNGIVEIKAVAREAGFRSKIAVLSHDENVDPIGACVGSRGTRVQNIINELRGEKIDIVKYDEDIKQYAAAALSPAQITDISVDEDEKICNITVPENQVSLAIGKEGQSVRLAAKLVGWKLDIKTESQTDGFSGETQE